VEPNRLRLDEYLAQWLERKRAEGLKPKTLYGYGQVCRLAVSPVLGQVPLQDLSPAMIQAWQDRLAPTPEAPGAAQAALAYRCLRSALSDAERLGLVPMNPAKRARPALRTPRKREGLTLAEAHAVLAAAEGEALAPLFAFVLYSGLRLGEALALRWADVDLEARRVIVRRNRVIVGGRMVEGSPKRERSARTIALLGGAVEALRRQRALQAATRLAAGDAWRDEDRVFSTGTGHGLDGGNVERAFRRVRERAGVRRLPLHSLRHARASILLVAGVPVAVAAKMLGHSVTLFCETYADLLVEATHDAARQADEWLARQAPSPRVSGGEAAGPAEPLLIGHRGAGRRR
jgi:integrase